MNSTQTLTFLWTPWSAGLAIATVLSAAVLCGLAWPGGGAGVMSTTDENATGLPLGSVTLVMSARLNVLGSPATWLASPATEPVIVPFSAPVAESPAAVIASGVTVRLTVAVDVAPE